MNSAAAASSFQAAFHPAVAGSVSWREMVSHRSYLVRFAQRKLHDPMLAEDVVHDVFEAVISGRAAFAGRSALRSWLTAKSTELDRVLGLELGADDYLTKPFSLGELLARVKALLRRADLLRAAQANAQAQPSTLRNGDLEILPAKRQVRYRGEALDFTALEFDLLLHFAQHPGHVFSRGQLLNAVWGYTHDGYEHTVTTHINRLRAKLESDPMRPQLILTVRGAGYKMREAPR